jgi:hypothetical protein
MSININNNINATNNQYKIIKQRGLEKINSTIAPSLSENTYPDKKQLYLRKNYNSDEFQQFKFNNANLPEVPNSKDTFKYRITRVNINSAFRNIIPKNITSNEMMPVNNPFSSIKNTNILQISYKDHGLTENDKIIIDNVYGSNYTLNTLVFTKNSNYVQIYHQNHGMHPFDKNKIYSNYQISISNLLNGINTYILNIPLNAINNYQTVYFNTTNSDNYNQNYYYIKLPISANDNLTFTGTFNVTYNHINGIPIPYINANYPINSNYAQGYHIVDKIINNDIFQITLPYVANDTISNFGGNDILIDKVVDNIDGYPNNNHYIISLNKTFYNVYKIKLISTEFPNTEKIIKDSPLNRQNNKLFWQIIGDGDHVYDISITPGNYDIQGLITEMQNQIQKVELISYNKNANTTKYQYTSTHYVDISINTNTSIFSIKFFAEIVIENPFIVSNDSNDSNIYILEVYHPNHLLSIGSQIVIQNSLDVGVVPSYMINTSHYIYEITDKDKYRIKLKKFNPLNASNSSNSSGGLAVQIRYPLISRLLLDKPGSIGKCMGFRNVGDYNSITTWDYTIYNNTPYINDLLVDTVGTPISSSSINNYINLNGDNYILIANPLFKNTVDTGSINGVFAKLLLAGLPGYILFNQYIQLGEEFKDNIQSLSELEFFFYTPDGSLYDFNGIDHSFTIEIYEKITENENLNISSKSGFVKEFNS